MYVVRNKDQPLLSNALAKYFKMLFQFCERDKNITKFFPGQPSKKLNELHDEPARKCPKVYSTQVTESTDNELSETV